MSQPILMIACLFLGSAAAAGCVPAQAAPARSTPDAAPAVQSPRPASGPAASSSVAGERAKPASEPHVYRLDFVLSGKDGGSGAPNTSFTLNLEENRAGEVMIGKNVALVAATPTGSAPPPASPRQDVGLKVKVVYRTVGEDVLLEVTTEMSALDAPTTIRKVLARSSALARPGKATLVVSLEDDHKRYDLSMTPTKLR